MAAERSILNKILKLAPIQGNNDDALAAILADAGAVEAGTTMKTLENWCVSIIKKKSQRAPITLFTLIGKVFDKHIPRSNDSGYGTRMTALRDAIRDTYADKAAKIIEDSKISNRQRTIEKNAKQKVKRDARLNDAFGITMEKIERLCKKMIKDITTNEYPRAIFLLAELVTGARTGEVTMAAKFTSLGKKKIGRKTATFIRQEGILKRERVDRKQQGAGSDDEEDGEEVDYDSYNSDSDSDEQFGGRRRTIYKPGGILEKPILPYVEMDFLLDKLAIQRAKEGVTIGQYDSGLSNRINSDLNKKLKSRYLAPSEHKKKDGSNFPITTHLFRGIYVAAAYQLYALPTETFNAFIHNTLGHTSVETGLSYSYVRILDGVHEVLLEDPADEKAEVDNGDGLDAKHNGDEDPGFQNEGMDMADDEPIILDAPAEAKAKPKPKPKPREPAAEANENAEEIKSLKSEVRDLKKQLKDLTALVQKLIDAQPVAPVAPPAIAARDDNLEEKQPAAAAAASSIRRSARKPVPKKRD